MEQVQHISQASDRILAALVEGLEIEFGHGAGEALAHRFLAAEASEFCWDARVSERWIGSYANSECDEDIELDRVRILGFLDGEWFVATVIVDGEGIVHGMSGKREFTYARDAWAAFAQA